MDNQNPTNGAPQSDEVKMPEGNLQGTADTNVAPATGTQPTPENDGAENTQAPAQQ